MLNPLKLYETNVKSDSDTLTQSFDNGIAQNIMLQAAMKIFLFQKVWT